MGVVFAEFENENALRQYPFAAGCAMPQGGDREIPPGVFVDAMLYPVNPDGTVYLSGISRSGVFSVSDSKGVVMTGVASGNVVEFRDTSGLGRRSGVMVASSTQTLADLVAVESDRSYKPAETAFASACLLPIVMDGVTSFTATGLAKLSGVVGFSNGPDSEFRVSSGSDGTHDTLRFDVLPRLAPPSGTYIKRIICVVDGQTPFDISKIGDCKVAVTLDGIDRETVCAAAHREDTYEMADTCKCAGEDCAHGKYASVNLPHKLVTVEVNVPSVRGNGFYLVSPNVPGYVNPISITLEDGAIIPSVAEPEVSEDGTELVEGALVDNISAKGVVIQVPGLGGGGA